MVLAVVLMVRKTVKAICRLAIAGLLIVVAAAAHGQATTPTNVSVDFTTGAASWGMAGCGGNAWQTSHRTSSAGSWTTSNVANPSATIPALANPDYGEFRVRRAGGPGCNAWSPWASVSYTATTLALSLEANAANLHGATLRLTLGDDETTRTDATSSPETFLSGAAASHFTLDAPAVTGLTLSSVSTTEGGRTATLTLAHTGVVAPGNSIAVNVAAAAHSGSNVLTASAVFLGDYDDNDNGLIDIRTLAQLNAIRWDLDGDGTPANANAASYRTAFPSPAAGMGCPDTAADVDTDPGPCTGYELRADLDFDTDGDGATHASGVSDADDAYHNGGSGWDPIGPGTPPGSGTHFNATFNGNGHRIANLFVKRSRNQSGLFAVLAPAAKLSALGLTNARIQDGRNAIGALVGLNRGRIAASHVSGSVSGSADVGGLAGRAERATSIIVASYSTASVSCASTASTAAAGGFAGANASRSRILASYSTGTVTGACPNKHGFASNSATVTASYWDAERSAIADDAGSAAPEGLTSSALQTPTQYGSAGIYAAWNDQDVDGDGASGEAIDDDAWHFGTANQHPVLKFSGLDVQAQLDAQLGLAVSPASLSLNEDPGSTRANIGRYTLNLSDAPNGSVTVTATSDNPAVTLDSDATPLTKTLIFTASNWNSAQTVTATAVADSDGVDELAIISNAAPGIEPQTLRAVVSDDERTGTDYDRDEDGLIEISSLAQLNAVRWDTDGNGTVSIVDVARYGLAFPLASASMGCPDGGDANQTPDPCIGYELAADLDFATDAGASSYANWTPIGFYNARFRGNGRTISNLAINDGTRRFVGLFGQLGSDGRIEGLGLLNASLRASGNRAEAGALAGRLSGAIVASYSTGSVIADSAGPRAAHGGGLVGVMMAGSRLAASFSMAAASADRTAGGLVGTKHGGLIVASYATGPVRALAGAQNLGGLVGRQNAGSIRASYARGAVGTAPSAGGLTGTASSAGAYAASYWNRTASGQSASGGGTGQTAGALQSPTSATGIYEDWAKVDVDGDGIASESPWDFGSATQYPLLNYGSLGLESHPQLFDYDIDDDGLIEIYSLAQLNAIRWDLDGDGAPVSGNAAAYAEAFSTRGAILGCPTTTTDADDHDCTGYELANDLDFDTDGDGDVDADDPGSYPNWWPTGSWATTFSGDGHSISNLTINHQGGGHAGLFSNISAGATVRALGLIEPKVNSSRANINVGALSGGNSGTIIGCYVLGGSVIVQGGNTIVGGLVGGNGNLIRSSYSTAAVRGDTVGGLTGANANVRSHTVRNSYAVPSSISRIGGNSIGALIGTAWNGTVTNAYWDKTRYGQGGFNVAGHLGKTTSELQSPATYTGIYAPWDDTDGDAWDFGADYQYPVLKFGGLDTAVQFAGQRPTFGSGSVSQQRIRAGQSMPQIQVPQIRGDRAVTYTATGLPEGLSFDADGSGPCTAARAICGTPSAPPGTYRVTISATDANGRSGTLVFNILVRGILLDMNPATAWLDPGPLQMNELPAVNRHTYSVRLSEQPTGAVTVTISSPDPGAVEVDGGASASLQFSATSWNTAQLLTLTAVPDGDIDAESLAISHSAAGGGFTGASIALQVSVADDDRTDVLVDADPATAAIDPGPLLLKEGAAPSASYAVRLASEPSAAVTVRLTRDNPAVTVDADPAAGTQTSLHFTAQNWSTWQTVTATTAADSDPVDEASIVTHTAAGAAEFAGIATRLRIGVQDSGRTGADYDTDEDGLIEISNLAQLNAIRWDPDGNGAVSAGNAASYGNAFPGASTRMGCPDGPDSNQSADACRGYELARDLDFDTDGDGDVDANDPGSYANWAPIGAYAAIFDGNGFMIANLTHSSSAAQAGLFAEIGATGWVRRLGLLAPNVTAGGTNGGVGALAGVNRGTVAACYAVGGSVASTGASDAVAGGLVGWNPGRVRASHAEVAVGNSGQSSSRTGGLIGLLSLGGTVVASYAKGQVAASGTSTVAGGLVAYNDGSAITDSYWDNWRTRATGDSVPSTLGKTTGQLRRPTGHYGIYQSWDESDIDGDGKADAPWHFGTHVQYPALSFNGNGAAMALQRGDYDQDDDGLIELHNLAQLNAVRWDLDGDGAPATGAEALWEKAFRNHPAGMGCPTNSDDADNNDCTGYELATDLNFDTDGDGDVDASDPDSYSNWVPIGGLFSASFDGQGHSIRNLRINRPISSQGLFAAIGPTAKITSVALPNARLRGGASSAGALVGRSEGRVAASWSSGHIQAGTQVGGLIGRAETSTSRIVSSYSMATVDCTKIGAGQAAGLVGHLGAGAQASASYASGAVTGACDGKGGFSQGVGTVAASYWDASLSGLPDDADASSPEGRASATLRTPTEYGSAGLYATWDDVDVDGDSSSGEKPDDDAWSFGSATQLPVLKLARFSLAEQFAAQRDPAADVPPLFGSAAVAARTLLPGQLMQAFAVPAAAGGNGALSYAASGLPVGVSFDADGTGSCSAARTLCGTPSTAGNYSVRITVTDADANTQPGDSASFSFAISVGDPSATLSSSPAPLTESNLNGASLTLTLMQSTFLGSATASDFTLTTNVPGLTLGALAPVTAGDASATLTLAYDGSDFDVDRTLSLTLAAAAHAQTGALTTPDLTASPTFDLTVTPTSLALNENPGAASSNVGAYAVVLEAAPTANVTVTAASPDPAVTLGADASPLSVALVFTASNWNTPQTVTATAAQDGDGDDESVTLINSAPGPGSLADAMETVSVTVADDDIGALLLDTRPATPALDPGPLALKESQSDPANARIYSLRLSAQPTGGVTVALSSGDAAALTLIPASLQFTAGNWNTAQLVTAAAQQDEDALDESVTLSHSASGAGYNGVQALLQASVADDERAGIDYDKDEDGLIEISSLAQLNAMRLDLDGDGEVWRGVAAAFARGFPGPSPGMGCPSVDGGAAACRGYELAQDLDFDTDGDGDVDASDDYPSWEPIDNYEGFLEGNGRAIFNLTISDSATRFVGLFGRLARGGRVQGLGLLDASISATASRTEAGALAGRLSGTVIASHSTGSVTGNSTGSAQTGGLIGQMMAGSRLAASHSSATVAGSQNVGGLVGTKQAGQILASYAAGTVRALTGAQSLGGLAGRHDGGGIRASYARGTVESSPGAGGLTGTLSRAGDFAASHWDIEASGRSDSGGGTGQTTSAMQTPTSATGIYAGWDRLDVDGDGNADEAPWHFGTASQHPRLDYGGLHPSLQSGDYDQDDNGLIEIYSLAQLNAMRWDLDGDGAPAARNAAAYARAFRNRRADMGCPTSEDDADDNDCAGYELANDLDFDTDGDGSTWTGDAAAPVPDPDDAHYNGGGGWDPIGPASTPSDSTHFNATFDGKGHLIRNLFINRRGRNLVGLFSALRTSAVVRSLGLSNAWVSGNWSAAPLVGESWGRSAAVWTSGSARGLGNVGGLAGIVRSGGEVVASYSTAAAACLGSGATHRVGGLVGLNQGAANAIATSYSTGAVTGPCPASAKSGLASGGTIAASYWDTTLSGIQDDTDTNSPEGRTSTQLQTPTGYGSTGLYATWNDQDVDDDGTSGEAGDDDAWDFGTASHHPALKFGGLDVAAQYSHFPPSFGAGTVPGKTARTGQDIQAFQVPAATHVTGSLSYWATGLPPGMSFDADGRGACSAARTICGAPTRAGQFNVTVWALNVAGTGVGLSFTISVGGIEIDADPGSPATTEPGPLALSENQARTTHARAYAVRLTSAPNAAVTLTIASSDTDALRVDDTDGRLGGLQNTLSFNTLNWNTWQLVTARAVQDADLLDETLVLTHSASGGGYGGQSATLAATVADDDRLGPEVLVDANPATAAIDPGPLLLDEASARSKSYLVRLSSQPAAAVTLALASDNPAVTLDASALHFTDASWSTAQTVRATTGADADAVDEASNVTHRASGAPEYDGLAKTLRVGVSDAQRAGADYDRDEDGLIDIDSLAKLNALRWDLDGNGAVSAGDAANYGNAFPGAAADMGCPDGPDEDQESDGCAGYNLTRDLDFDTDGDGDVDADDPGSFTNWWPIGYGAYQAIFDGGGHVIANLRSGRGPLFWHIGGAGQVRNLGLVAPRIVLTTNAAALANVNQGTILACYAIGGSVRSTNWSSQVGGLIRELDAHARVYASYAGLTVDDNRQVATFAGGLATLMRIKSTIAYSYTWSTLIGSTHGSARSGGLVASQSRSQHNPQLLGQDANQRGGHRRSSFPRQDHQRAADAHRL